ncbi:MAG: zinc-dependent alcohol dehydrogenase family protein [Ignavibacterium sp.]
MRAMILENICDLAKEKSPLKLVDIPIPQPKENEILIKISSCGVCHTELDEIEGRTAPKFFPIVLGHQTVGKVIELGEKTDKFKIGDRVGVAWIFSSCGKCKFCLEGNENLCSNFKATGKDVNGGYAEYVVVNEAYAYKIPNNFLDSEAAPLLCAGAIGYRSLKLTEIKNGENIGLTGFGASAHLVLKLIKYVFPDTKIFVFARSDTEREFALELGADWSGSFSDYSPEKLSAIIDTTPVWQTILHSLENLAPNGRLIINAIRKENSDKNILLELDYAKHLWMEKEIKTVANVTRDDVKIFLDLASKIPIKPEYQEYELKDANLALIELKERKIRGAKVLRF